MTPYASWPVPFILSPSNLAIDAVTAFVVSVLLACMVNAEAQAFASTLLGDTRVGAKDRFNFNVFLHLDILGSICYLVGGFGWSRTMEIDRSKFAHPRLYTAITRLAGPVANFLLAGIGASLVTIMTSLEWEPRVFLMVIGVNVTTAIYNLIPIPPLALGSVICEAFPHDEGRAKAILTLVGPYLIVALVLLERITHQGIISPYLDPLIKTVYAFFRGA
jgi:Zn-dependent protease